MYNTDTYDPSAILGWVGAYAACIIVFVLLMFALMIVAYWKILEKAGYSGAWALLMLVPGLNGIASLGILLVLAFSEWPALKRPAAPMAPPMYPPVSGAQPAYVPPAPPAQPAYAPPPPPMAQAAPPVAPAPTPEAVAPAPAPAPAVEPPATPAAAPVEPVEIAPPPAPPAAPEGPEPPIQD